MNTETSPDTAYDPASDLDALDDLAGTVTLPVATSVSKLASTVRPELRGYGGSSPRAGTSPGWTQVLRFLELLYGTMERDVSGYPTGTRQHPSRSDTGVMFVPEHELRRYRSWLDKHAPKFEVTQRNTIVRAGGGLVIDGHERIVPTGMVALVVTLWYPRKPKRKVSDEQRRKLSESHLKRFREE